MSQAVVKAAKAWVGRHFNQGVPEQCMAFVRQVLRDAQHPLRDKVTGAAVDGLSTSYYLASSLAGRDLGELVSNIYALKPGAILFFQNTYGDWDPGTITHVGIYAGAGRMIHRRTMSHPVEEVDLVPGSYWGSFFRCGLLLAEAKAATPAPPAPAEPQRLKTFANERGVTIYHRGKEVPATRVVIDVHDGKIGVRVNGETWPVHSLSLDIVTKS